ncbi:hypothetical protein M3P05_05620 [Sansalvadorimonas sp. 2012CJ34-2]|uniref:Probable membrane transporter protein n=1 Tax=Parendozoicomonas callyspongiae TaxID=2942213 RepID=A0ABT0PDN7_9GAMM|nr:TSUP family transporter [Sansalvadorimonas sp. 2012CJ34-2]MCL6269423.1 hypothetical protein [Sansalvadorimonas sp. 2012CJ34-2]
MTTQAAMSQNLSWDLPNPFILKISCAGEHEAGWRPSASHSDNICPDRRFWYWFLRWFLWPRNRLLLCHVLRGSAWTFTASGIAHTKALNFTSNIFSLGFFLADGHVIVLLGLVMMAGQLIGARIGSKMVMTKGQKLIRPMMVVIYLVMSAKLLWESFG